MIATRVSNLSSSRHIFENECKVYNHALIHAGYRQELQYYDNNGKVENRKSKKGIYFGTTHPSVRMLKRMLPKHS